MALHAITVNPYIWEVFFTGTAPKINGFNPRSNWEDLKLALESTYRANQELYLEFATWLQSTLAESIMQNLIMQYFDLTHKLAFAPVRLERTKLFHMLSALKV